MVESHNAPHRPNQLVSVQFKAFGDFVIAVNSIGRRVAPAGDGMAMLVAAHLQPLLDVMDLRIPYSILDHVERTVPAMVSVRKEGVVRALKSAAGLKRAMIRANVPADVLLVFDKLDKRERFLAAGRCSVALPAEDNIYFAYDRFLDQQGFGFTDMDFDAAASGPLRIFPGSRLQAKHVPLKVIEAILTTAATCGIKAELMLLNGESPELEASGLPFTPVSRDFASLIDAVRGAGRVVSADSMPAHMAEYVGRPVFVYSPVSNRYWLPRSSYAGGWEALFSDDGHAARLAEFLKAPHPAQSHPNQDRWQ